MSSHLFVVLSSMLVFSGLLLTSPSALAAPPEQSELQLSGRALIPLGSAKCARRGGCWCEFRVRQVGLSCRVSESREDATIRAEEFSSHQESTRVFDGGSAISVCGLKLRCELLPAERCTKLQLQPDGGLSILDGGAACEENDGALIEPIPPPEPAQGRK